jgi:hypothetical protein
VSPDSFDQCLQIVIGISRCGGIILFKNSKSRENVENEKDLRFFFFKRIQGVTTSIISSNFTVEAFGY